jgi:hypothetical protein
LLDLYRIVVDATNGQYTSGYSGDGTHPNATAIAAAIAVFGPQLANIENLMCPPYMAAVSESGANAGFWQLVRNGAFANSASPPTPDGWTVNSSGATVTLDAPTQPYSGKVFDYVKASGGAAYALSGANITLASGGFAVGDTLFMSGRMNVSGLTPGRLPHDRR